jgi:hypothetical protein
VQKRPEVTSIVPGTTGGCSLTFTTLAGKAYRVEYKSSLDASDWQALGQDTVATGDRLVITDPTGGLSQRFYRISVLD